MISRPYIFCQGFWATGLCSSWWSSCANASSLGKPPPILNHKSYIPTCTRLSNAINTQHPSWKHMVIPRIPGLKIFLVLPSESLIHPNVIPSILVKLPAAERAYLGGAMGTANDWVQKPLAIEEVFTYYASMSISVFSFLIYGCLWMSMAQIQFLNGAMEATVVKHGWPQRYTTWRSYQWGIISCPSPRGLILCTSIIYLQCVSEVFHLTRTVFFRWLWVTWGQWRKFVFTHHDCALKGRTRTRAFFEIWIAGLTVDPPQTLCQV